LEAAKGQLIHPLIVSALGCQVDVITMKTEKLLKLDVTLSQCIFTAATK
jgi:hypothetical protein